MLLGHKISKIARTLTIVVASDTRFVFFSVIPDFLPGNYLNIQHFLHWLLISAFYNHKFDILTRNYVQIFIGWHFTGWQLEQVTL